MHRAQMFVLALVLAGVCAGCGEDQPNAPTPPEATNADFGKSSQDMMKSANSGMDLKKARADAAATPKP